MNLPPTVCAPALAAAALIAAFVASHARPVARDYIRFSASLYASLSLAELIAIANPVPPATLAADCVALLVTTLAPLSLALAVRSRFDRRSGPLFSTTLLLAGCACGVIAATTGLASVAIAGLLVALGMMLQSAFRARRTEPIAASYAAVSALALLAGAAALMSERAGNLSAYALFAAAGLTGITWASSGPSHVAVQRPALRDQSDSRISRAR